MHDSPFVVSAPWAVSSITVQYPWDWISVAPSTGLIYHIGVGGPVPEDYADLRREKWDAEDCLHAAEERIKTLEERLRLVENQGILWMRDDKVLHERLRHGLAIVDAAEKCKAIRDAWKERSVVPNPVNSYSADNNLDNALREHAKAARGEAKPVAFPDGTLTMYGHAMKIVDATEKWSMSQSLEYQEVREHVLDVQNALREHAAAARGEEPKVACSDCGRPSDGYGWGVPPNVNENIPGVTLCRRCLIERYRRQEKGTGPHDAGEKGKEGVVGEIVCSDCGKPLTP